MPDIHSQGLVKKRTLTEAEAFTIEQLIKTCNNYERLYMRIDVGALRQKQDDEANDFLYYEDNKLVGYLFVEGWGSRDREIMGMVHPDYRRRGIFSSLLAAARKECRMRDVRKMILVCEHTSQSGLAFIQAIGAHLEFSEHEMVLGTFQERRNVHKGLDIRQASRNDLDAIISILATDSGNKDSISKWVTKQFDDQSSSFYLAMLDGKPLGCLRLDDMSDQIGIYAFEVRLGYRGRGYGRQMLEEAIRSIRAETQKHIMLDVETDNTNAIGLYRSCCFEIKTTYDYYNLPFS